MKITIGNIDSFDALTLDDAGGHGLKWVPLSLHSPSPWHNPQAEVCKPVNGEHYFMNQLGVV